MQWPWAMRGNRVDDFVLLEVLKSTLLEDLIGLVVGEHSIEVKCNTQLIAAIVCVGGSKYLAGWIALRDGITHVAFVRRQK